MKSFLDCLGLKTGFSWIYGHIAEKQVQFHGQKRFNKLWFNIQRFKRTQSVKFRITTAGDDTTAGDETQILPFNGY